MLQNLLAKPLVTAITLILAQTTAAQDFAAQRQRNWHQWRGPEANGTAPLGNPPLEWSDSATGSKNIKWKVAIPGKGAATPIVWGDRIFVLTAIPMGAGTTGAASAQLNRAPVQVMAQPQGGQPGQRRGPAAGRGGRGGAPAALHKFEVLCLDRRTGQTIWQRTAKEVVPHEGHHETSSFAAASPVTDGQRLYVSFGSRGIHCFDLSGTPLWEKDLGRMTTKLSFGEGASPAISNNRLVVAWDHEAGSFIVAFDATTGEEKWRTPREEATTWGTPLMVPYAGRVQVVANGTNRVRSYDLDTGEMLWECGGQGPNAIPSPVAIDDMVIAMTGFRQFAAIAIPLNARGDVTNSEQLRWKLTDHTPYVSSPLLYDGILYVTKERANLLSTIDARTGEVLIDKVRLPNISNIYASPVGAAGRVYLSSREGTTVVIEHGRGKEMKVLATNQLPEAIDASPAIVGNQLFIRSGSNLYCIEGTP
jgi:outer membrane protein assembly factor BamB